MNSDKGMNASDGNHPAYPSRKRLNHRGPLSVDVVTAWYFITICAKDHVPWSMRDDRVGRDDLIAPGKTFRHKGHKEHKGFHDLLRSQNEASRALLKAVAEEGCIASPTGGDFLSKHGFSSHSTVRSALKNLLDGDLLYQTDKGYIVYDRLFGMWLSRL